MRTCRKCGCTDTAACLTPSGACFWVEPDLCSNCIDGWPKPGDAEALASLEPFALELDAQSGFYLLGLLQLSLRHPGLAASGGPSWKFGQALCGLLTDCLSVTPNLRAICLAGADPKFAARSTASASRIILPRG